MSDTTPPLITAHCVERYLERVAPPALRCRPELEARRLAYLELYCALSQEPLCRLTTATGKTLLGLINPAGYRFMILLTEGGRHAETCGPIWYWHESRLHWRAQGHRCSKGDRRTRQAACLRRKARRKALADEEVCDVGTA